MTTEYTWECLSDCGWEGAEFEVIGDPAKEPTCPNCGEPVEPFCDYCGGAAGYCSCYNGDL